MKNQIPDVGVFSIVIITDLVLPDSNLIIYSINNSVSNYLRIHGLIILSQILLI
jgi:hypothetical protein